MKSVISRIGLFAVVAVLSLCIIGCSSEQSADSHQNTSSASNGYLEEGSIPTEEIQLNEPVTCDNEFEFTIDSVEWLSGKVPTSKITSTPIEDGKVAFALRCSFMNLSDAPYASGDIRGTLMMNDRYEYQSEIGDAGEAAPLEESQFIIWFELPNKAQEEFETGNVTLLFDDVYLENGKKVTNRSKQIAILEAPITRNDIHG